MGIELTDKAVREIHSIIEERKFSSERTYLRLGVEAGGCSGFSYTLDLTATKTKGDEEFEVEGIKCIVDSKSYRYLEGVLVDYTDEITGRGFIFNNPNAISCCSCGRSFRA
jgi:iron-sulfur cluster assembly protein